MHQILQLVHQERGERENLIQEGQAQIVVTNVIKSRSRKMYLLIVHHPPKLIIMITTGIKGSRI